MSSRSSTSSTPKQSSCPPIDEWLVELPAEKRGEFEQLVALTDAFCDAQLNDEYKELARDMALILFSDGVPPLRGKSEAWGCAIIYTLGWVNFLTDPSNSPHLRAEEIAAGFHVSEATMHNRARTLRNGLDLVRLDPEWTLPSRLEDNPLAWLVMVNGIPVDVRMMPLEVRQIAYEKGLIPFVPGQAEPDLELLDTARTPKKRKPSST